MEWGNWKFHAIFIQESLFRGGTELKSCAFSCNHTLPAVSNNIISSTISTHRMATWKRLMIGLCLFHVRLFMLDGTILKLSMDLLFSTPSYENYFLEKSKTRVCGAESGEDNTVGMRFFKIPSSIILFFLLFVLERNCRKGR